MDHRVGGEFGWREQGGPIADDLTEDNARKLGEVLAARRANR